jgi:hypothetical protein
MEMILIEFTDIAVINHFVSVFVNITFVTAPLFGALALIRH